MPRLRQSERHQLGWHAVTIDDLVARDHPARAMWACVQRLDSRALHDAVKGARGSAGAGAPTGQARGLKAHGARADDGALWLWATVDGVGSARQLVRLRVRHLAYRWLCGGVSINYTRCRIFA
jgi:hypothetical protein